MSARHTLFPYPRGRDTAALYDAMRTTIDGLNRMVTQIGLIEAIDVAALQAALAAATAALDSLTAELLVIRNDLDTTNITIEGIDEALGTVSQDVLDTIAIVEGHTINIADNTAAISTEQTARIAEDEILANQIATVSADLETTSAALVTEQTARANGDTANATSISTVTTTVNNHTTAITGLTSSVNGISARWSMAITSQGYVTGLVQLSGTASYSNFTVVADTFQLAQPGRGGGTPRVAFAIGNVNGVKTLALRGDALIDGTIVTRAIAAGAVTADRLSVTSLSAINANLGTVSLGKMQDRASSPTCVFDLALQKWYNSTGSYIDMKNGRLLFVGA